LGEDDFVTVNITIEASIVRSITDKFDYNVGYFVEKVDKTDTLTGITYNKIIIDKKETDLSKSISVQEEGFNISKELKLELEGKKEYVFFSDITLVYKMTDDDDEYQLSAERFIDYLRISVKYSSNLKVVFVPLGNEVFENIKTTSNAFIKSYADVLLPEKGFRLVFMKKR
jgi:hypothetical protein